MELFLPLQWGLVLLGRWSFCFPSPNSFRSQTLPICPLWSSVMLMPWKLTLCGIAVCGRDSSSPPACVTQQFALTLSFKSPAGTWSNRAPGPLMSCRMFMCQVGAKHRLVFYLTVACKALSFYYWVGNTPSLAKTCATMHWKEVHYGKIHVMFLCHGTLIIWGV